MASMADPSSQRRCTQWTACQLWRLSSMAMTFSKCRLTFTTTAEPDGRLPCPAKGHVSNDGCPAAMLFVQSNSACSSGSSSSSNGDRAAKHRLHRVAMLARPAPCAVLCGAAVTY
eukprot:358421-Chlamydomonas_euryale.AAC.8